MNEETVIVFDCGSTNLRVAAVDSHGQIVAQASLPNGPIPQPNGKPGWLIWDFDDIWHKLCTLCKEVIAKIEDRYQVLAIIVTTWGADGTLVRKDGRLTYPVISWQCSRTREIVDKLLEIIDPWEIFQITGYQVISFNTLLKLMWIKKYAPEAFKEAYTWLMMPGLISYRLCNEFHIDPISASTMMAMDLKKRDWSTKMLSLADLDPGFFPEWREPGEVLGYVTEKASRLASLKKVFR